MGIRGEIFTTQIQAENRTYFFNVKENTRGDMFLQIVESKSVEGSGFDRHAVVIFEDELRQFMTGFNDSLKFMEKVKKAKFKKDRTGSFEKKERHDDYKKDNKWDNNKNTYPKRERSFNKNSNAGNKVNKWDNKKPAYPKTEKSFDKNSNAGNRAGLFKKKHKVRVIKKD